MLKDPRVAALGEIGLDYHYDFSPRDDQREAFRRQLRLAKEAGLPVALHLREAHDEALAIMREEGFPEAGTLLHCFNLDWATLEPWVEEGCYVAFGGALTFKNADDTRARPRSPRAGGSSAHRDGCAVHDARTYARHDLPARSRAVHGGAAGRGLRAGARDPARGVPRSAHGQYARTAGSPGTARQKEQRSGPCKRLIISGSPRARGRSAGVAEAVRFAFEESCADDDVQLISLADVRISPCTGCETCADTLGRNELYCIISDDMLRVRGMLNACDQLTVVSPVYFAGAPSQLKAFLDRLQPYFYANWRAKPKRPASLYVAVGRGRPRRFQHLWAGRGVGRGGLRAGIRARLGGSRQRGRRAPFGLRRAGGRPRASSFGLHVH